MNIHQLSITYLPEQDRILARVNTTAGEELRLWLTRRLMVGLWPLLSKAMTERLLRLEAAGSSLDAADDQLKQMLTDFRKQEFLQHADFATPYRKTETEPDLPLGEEPLLVTDVDATPLPNGRLRLHFNESARLRDSPLTEASAPVPEAPKSPESPRLPESATLLQPPQPGQVPAAAAPAQPAVPAPPRRFQMEMEPRLMQGLLHLLEQALVQSRWREPFLSAVVDDASATESSSRASRPRYLN